jgi:plasmid maintenance system antidote protein VapI
MIPTPADLRAEIARRQIRLYEFAPRVGLDPAHIGKALRGRAPMSPELALKIQQALDSERPAAS